MLLVPGIVLRSVAVSASPVDGPVVKVVVKVVVRVVVRVVARVVRWPNRSRLPTSDLGTSPECRGEPNAHRLAGRGQQVA